MTKPKPRGRPKLEGGRATLIVYLPHAMKETLDEIAARRGVPVSELARDALAKLIAKETRK